MRLLLAVFAAAAVAATPALSADTLYDDLGGRDGVNAILARLFTAVTSDPRTAPSFEGADIPVVHERLARQICDISDGPCTYDGLSMADAHIGLEVTEVQMNAMIELLQDAMAAEDVPFRTQNKLLARLATFHRDIVTAR